MAQRDPFTGSTTDTATVAGTGERLDSHERHLVAVRVKVRVRVRVWVRVRLELGLGLN
jgi:hypothetical protein